MRAMKIVSAIAALLLGACLPAYSQTNSVSVNIDGLPETGTYFIINASSNEALQPNGPSLGQNVFLSEFNKGGMQQWKINRKIDPVTKKATNRYTIRLAGENEELNFQPHPSVSDRTPILGLDQAVFVLEPANGGVFVKSVARNGDAMYAFQASPPEAHFGPSDGSQKFLWNFISTSGTGASTAVINADSLPKTGTYFIVNSANHAALQPNGPSLGQNVFLSEFNRGGTQKWRIDRKVDPVTNKPTNRYTIRLAGEIDGLNFQPHPSLGDACPVLGMDKAVFLFEPSQDGLLVKSVAQNGDALSYTQSSAESAEPVFRPDDGSKRFRWNFISTD